MAQTGDTRHSKYFIYKPDFNLAGKFFVVVSKKVLKKSHERNKLRRRVKEIIRTQIIPDTESRCKGGVIFAKRGAGNLDFPSLKEEIDNLCR